MRATPVERADHVDAARMRHISRTDLLAGIGAADADLPEVRHRLARRVAAHPPVWDPRRRADELDDDALAEEIAAADELLERHTDFLSPQAGRSGLYGLHYLGWLRPLVTAYLATGDDRYAAGFARHFDDWYASRDDVVGEWPGLDVVWYSLGVWARATVVAPAVSAFAETDAMPDDTMAAALATLLGGARWAAEEHEAFRPGNWQLVCAGELLHVAGLLHEAPEAPHWVDVGRARLVEHLDRDFYADGGHLERSPGYHALCLEALQRAAVVARRDHGFDLAVHPTFRAAHRWLAEMATPAGWVPPWQDSGTVWPGEALERAAGILPGSGVDEPARRSVHLADSGYVVLRGDGPSSPFLALNAGPYVAHELESHSHLAATDVVLSAWRAPLALEAGGPATYDDPRYQDWYRSPWSHNTVTLDGHEMSEDRDAAVVVADLDGPVQVVVAQHDGYPLRVTRRVLFVSAEPGYWLFSDRVDGEAPATWSILAPRPWLAHAGGFRSEGAPFLSVVPADPPGQVVTETGPGQVPGAGAASYQELTALRLRSATGRFDVLLAPGREAGEPAWSLRRAGGGWLVENGLVADRLTDGLWERRTSSGRLLGSARWRA
ncbi:heparinase II/III family protein [Jiangella endophytica]|uniref:heparinase II/III family protein n=1 Tax=Jiangella endophytica TaxID=1623398 RepID=UPI000E34EE79|nr:heparinase II/III family protein [Jiangella endophytica]